MCDVATIPGIAGLWAQTLGDARICVAVIDGPVDTGHPAFDGASLARAEGAWPEERCDGPLGRHGTAVASVIFGQHHGPVPGVAPGCRGISSPAFSDLRGKQSQLEMARAIEAAVESGAHVINISGGQLSPSGEAFDLLDHAVALCHERNVLIVAAAGNDGCFCDHVPAALPSVLAVGALGDGGLPLASSNWGRTYQDHGLLAPGENILTAVPGGGTVRVSGTSLATPIVAGVAALLLSLQLRAGRRPDPAAVRAALLSGVDPCELEDPQACERFLAGKLNIERAVSAVMSSPTEVVDTLVASCGDDLQCACGGDVACGCGGHAVAAGDIPAVLEDLPAAPAVVPSGPVSAVPAMAASSTASTASSAPAVALSASGVVPSAETTGYVYAFGTLDYDFGSEARRDSFKQAMTAFQSGAVPAVPTASPAQPYDHRQMLEYLDANESEAKLLIWTLNLELTPIYAIEGVGPYAPSVYSRLRTLLRGEFAPDPDNPDPARRLSHIERISIPGRKTDRTVKLFSGQVVPVIEVEQTRAVYGWAIDDLVDSVMAANPATAVGDASAIVRDFLVRVYYDLRNLGATSHDRALNYAASNLFQINAIAGMIREDMALDLIDVEKSPFCRMDSDCWDVKLRFFHTENDRRAREVYRFTVDVSDLIPVAVGEVRRWKEAS
jgi:cyanobactin maturation PatA/PatG family protease